MADEFFVGRWALDADCFADTLSIQVERRLLFRHVAVDDYICFDPRIVIHQLVDCL